MSRPTPVELDARDPEASFFFQSEVGRQIVHIIHERWLRTFPECIWFVEYVKHRVGTLRHMILVSARWATVLRYFADFDSDLHDLVPTSLKRFPEDLPDPRFISDVDYEWIQRAVQPTDLDRAMSGVMSPQVHAPDVSIFEGRLPTVQQSLRLQEEKLCTFNEFVADINNPCPFPTNEDHFISNPLIPESDVYSLKLHRYNIYRVLGSVDPTEWSRFLEVKPISVLRRIWRYIRFEVFKEAEHVARGGFLSASDIILASSRRIHTIERMRKTQQIPNRPYTAKEAHALVVKHLMRKYEKEMENPQHAIYAAPLHAFFKGMYNKHHKQ